METYPPLPGIGISPAAPPTRRLNYSLTPRQPLFADSNTFEEEVPLTVHVHAGIEFGILLSGVQERHFQGVSTLIQAGDVWLCGPWEPHGWRIAAPQTIDVVLMFLPDFLGEERLGDLSWLHLFVAPVAHRPQVRSAAVREQILTLGRQMQREIGEAQPAWQSAVRLDLLRCLLILGRTWCPPERAQQLSGVHAANLPRMMPALVMIQTRPTRRVSVGEAASACGLSRAHFSLVFRSTMGITFGKFCQTSRLASVAELLLRTDLPTDAIAEQTGFTDASHLHHSFVRQYACTPGQYRSENRLQDEPRDAERASYRRSARASR